MSSRQDNAFANFYDSARNNDILEPTTTIMIHLATAIAFGCGS